LSEIAKKLLPSSSANYPSRHNYAKLREELRKINASPKVLVLGGGVAGSGFEVLLSETEIDLLETDVFMTRRTRLVCDAHDIPFENQTFDAVVIQAVLEHVVDPWRCVEEIQRVLKDGGFVYAEVSFMQQVHAGRYDFTRFTHLGLRRLFRSFAEISSGVSCGPGTAAAWSVQHLALSFFEGRWSRWLAIVVARLASFWLRYLDRFLLDKPGALDAASSLYFLGSRSSGCLADQGLINLYRGAQ
jgi:SAM-dependent methyltransferase